MSEFRDCVKYRTRYCADSEVLEGALNDVPDENCIAGMASVSGDWYERGSAEVMPHLKAVMDCLSEGSKEKKLVPAIAEEMGETRATVYNIFKRIKLIAQSKLPEEFLCVAA